MICIEKNPAEKNITVYKGRNEIVVYSKQIKNYKVTIPIGQLDFRF